MKMSGYFYMQNFVKTLLQIMRPFKWNTFFFLTLVAVRGVNDHEVEEQKD